MGHHCIGHAVLSMHLLQPGGFRHLFMVIALGFHMHRRDHVAVFAGAAVVGRQEVMAQRLVVAQEKRMRVVVVLQPRVAAPGQVPQMMMGIDDGQTLRILGNAFCPRHCLTLVHVPP